MSPSDVHLFEARLVWTGGQTGAVRDYASYSRDLLLTTAGKPDLALSAAGAFRGDTSRYNPEDLLVGALSACHALSYLALAARHAIVVVSYEDRAVGEMTKIGGKIRFSHVVLRPRVGVEQGADLDRARRLHAQAHDGCFIASSVNFPVTAEPTLLEVSPPGHS